MGLSSNPISTALSHFGCALSTPQNYWLMKLGNPIGSFWIHLWAHLQSPLPFWCLRPLWCLWFFAKQTVSRCCCRMGPPRQEFRGRRGRGRGGCGRGCRGRRSSCRSSHRTLGVRGNTAVSWLLGCRDFKVRWSLVPTASTFAVRPSDVWISCQRTSVDSSKAATCSNYRRQHDTNSIYIYIWLMLKFKHPFCDNYSTWTHWSLKYPLWPRAARPPPDIERWHKMHRVDDLEITLTNVYVCFLARNPNE